MERGIGGIGLRAKPGHHDRDFGPIITSIIGARIGLERSSAIGGDPRQRAERACIDQIQIGLAWLERVQGGLGKGRGWLVRPRRSGRWDWAYRRFSGFRRDRRDEAAAPGSMRHWHPVSSPPMVEVHSMTMTAASGKQSANPQTIGLRKGDQRPTVDMTCLSSLEPFSLLLDLFGAFEGDRPDLKTKRVASSSSLASSLHRLRAEHCDAAQEIECAC